MNIRLDKALFCTWCILPGVGFANLAITPLVDATWIKANACNVDVVVLDIRSEKIDGQSVTDYRKGHVPCAVHTDYHLAGWRTKQDDVPGMLPSVAKLEALIGNLGIENNTHVVVSPLGVTAKSMSAATRVYWTFKLLGHDRVSILDGGTQGFAANKQHTLQTGSRTPESKTFHTTLRAEMLTTRADVERALAANSVLVDYRRPDEFLGINRHPKVKQRGTLPGARNLPIEWLTVNNSGQLRTRQGIEEIYRLAEIAPDQGHIAFCNTGHNSSLGWFVASEILGNRQVRVYDGSMAEWSRQANPVVDRRLSIAD